MTIAFNRLGVWLVLSSVLSAGLGCGRSGTPAGFASAVGTVTFQGKPVPGASVTFYPADGNDAAMPTQATTNDQGTFEMSTQVGGGKSTRGIAPGHYDVAVAKLDMTNVTSTSTPPKHILPLKFGNPKTSKLSANVAAGDNNFTFALKPE
jgi:hypothetical protein